MKLLERSVTQRGRDKNKHRRRRRKKDVKEAREFFLQNAG
jgi:hypothetical protein